MMKARAMKVTRSLAVGLTLVGLGAILAVLGLGAGVPKASAASTVTIRSLAITLNPGSSFNSGPACLSGTLAVGGGYEQTGTGIVVHASKPRTSGSQGWDVTAQNRGSTTATMTVYVTCIV